MPNGHKLEREVNAQQIAVPQEIVGLVGNAVQMAEALTIDGPVPAEIAGEDLKGLAKLKKQVEDTRFSITRPLDAAKNAAMDAYRPMLNQIAAADGIIRDKLNAYLIEQEQIRRRAEAEARAKAEAERREIEERARAAKEAGDQKALQAAEDDALLAELHAPVVAKAEKIHGISQATTWAVGDINLHELVKAAAADPQLLVYLTTTAEVSKTVKALGARHNIPGVTVKEYVGLRVRS